MVKKENVKPETEERPHPDSKNEAASDPNPPEIEAQETSAGKEEAVLDVEEELKQLKLELDEYKNLYLRKAAEFENYKKRKQQEFQALVQSAEESLVAHLLPVLDDLDRVKADDNTNAESLLEGIRLIRDKLWEILHSRGLEPIESVGKPFDPELHEAVLQRKVEGEAPDKVLEEHQRGYKFGGRVIRHAKVVVST